MAKPFVKQGPALQKAVIEVECCSLPQCAFHSPSVPDQFDHSALVSNTLWPNLDINGSIDILLDGDQLSAFATQLNMPCNII